jgi:thiol-disulfide isomerase/thioredoxin
MKERSAHVKSSRRSLVVAGLLASVLLCGVATSHAAGRRTPQQIAQEIQAVGQELAPLFASPQDLFDARKREAAAPKAIPTLRKMVALVEELQATRPVGAAEGQERAQLLALLSALGDKDADETLKKMASSPLAPEAAAGRSAQLVSRWMRSDADAAVQQKIVDDLQSLAKQYPTQDAVTAAAVMLAGTARPEAKAIRQRVRGIVATDLKTPKATAVVQQIDQTEAKLEAAGKLKGMEGKPLTVEAMSAAGSPLSTADFKGKVVLVDFWATWCKPCREELPRLKSTYAKYHDQGLEVVGVSCDNDAAELRKFLAENKDMPWPQLFDAAKPGWHPVALQYGINAIPRMFLIDRKGVLRSVDARETYETMIPQLLAERAR